MDASSTLDFLYALRNRGTSYGTDRMLKFMETLRRPDRAYPVIHVAGTNGKGSVCAMLERALRAGGYRTGLFTSPHLVHLGERVQVNRRILGMDEIEVHVAALRRAAKDFGEPGSADYPSFFEFMAALAFRCFADSKVDVAIVETGLGGRLDATNVVEPEATVITSVGLDHTDILGDTVQAIAAEKAGILKAGRPAVLGWLPAEARAVVQQRAAELGCPLLEASRVFGELPLQPLPQTNLSGSYQRRNAGTALLTLRTLDKIFPRALACAQEALLDVHWACRWQPLKLNDGRTLILDASHNEEGARALDENLASLRSVSGRKPAVLVGVLGLERALPLLAVIARHASAIYFAVPDQPRACSFAQLRASLPSGCRVPLTEVQISEVFPGPGRCLLGGPQDCLVATGSIYLTGEILARVTDGKPAQTDLQDRVSP